MSIHLLPINLEDKSNLKPIKELAPGEARTHNPGMTHCTVYKYRALTDCATGAHQVDNNETLSSRYRQILKKYCKLWGSNPRNLSIMRA